MEYKLSISQVSESVHRQAHGLGCHLTVRLTVWGVILPSDSPRFGVSSYCQTHGFGCHITVFKHF